LFTGAFAFIRTSQVFTLRKVNDDKASLVHLFQWLSDNDQGQGDQDEYLEVDFGEHRGVVATRERVLVYICFSPQSCPSGIARHPIYTHSDSPG
jgi:hypothetical protein